MENERSGNAVFVFLIPSVITISSTTKVPSMAPSTSTAFSCLTSKVPLAAGLTNKSSGFGINWHFLLCFHKLGYLLYLLPQREQQYARIPEVKAYC